MKKSIRLDGELIDLDTLIRGRVKIIESFCANARWIVPVWEDVVGFANVFRGIDPDSRSNHYDSELEYETYKPPIKDKKPSERITELVFHEAGITIKPSPYEQAILQHLDEQHELPEGK